MSDTLTVICGDALAKLRDLPNESVQCCVTSPPYWGLRDYGQNGQLGLEKTPEEYVGKMVEVFRELRRVLRNDGTLWLNLGDSYAGSGRGGNPEGSQWSNFMGCRKRMESGMTTGTHGVTPPPGLKAKDLVGIPWRVAFALQTDGWWLRSDIIWNKANCMPESVTDRPTRSHEYLFLLTKSARYYYDADAIKEPAAMSSEARWDQDIESQEGSHRANGGRKLNGTMKAVGGPRKDKQRGHSRRHQGFNDRWDQMEKSEQCSGMRNKRDVWTIAPANYPEAHFATFPQGLIKPCIMAGTSAKGCCDRCGAPWERVVERTSLGIMGGSPAVPRESRGTFADRQGASQSDREGLTQSESKTIGWQPTCKCDAEIEPCVCLDPFAGSGTTGATALELGRKAILIELNPKYIELIQQRCNVTLGLALA